MAEDDAGGNGELGRSSIKLPDGLEVAFRYIFDYLRVASKAFLHKSPVSGLYNNLTNDLYHMSQLSLNVP